MSPGPKGLLLDSAFRGLKAPAPSDRPFNGKILVRTEPELHRKAALRAAVEGVSLSRWNSRQFESAP
jgi:predicted HicB family RNase H-like nuclease